MTFLAPVVPIVVDASIAVAYLAEEDPQVDATWATWVTAGRSLIAPAHFWPEVGNALRMGRNAPPHMAEALLQALGRAGLETTDRGLHGVLEALALADRHRLTVYDALYLWLAIDIDAELATRDAAMIRAARAEGVPLAV